MSKLTAKTYAALDKHFTVGNVVYLSYWRSYDRVLSYTREPNSCSFVVTVCECDADGTMHGKARIHRTWPDFHRGDRVVTHLPLPLNK